MCNTLQTYSMMICIPAFVAMMLTVAAAMCPTQIDTETEWQFEIGSTCYQYIEDTNAQVSFDGASADCNDRGGNLLTIKDNTTEMALLTKLKEISMSHTVLLGLRNDQRVGWKWVTGEWLTYSNWEEQTECSYCNCAKMKLAMNGVWEKTRCAEQDWYTVYLCEYKVGNGQPSQGLSPLLTWTMLMTVGVSMLLH